MFRFRRFSARLLALLLALLVVALGVTFFFVARASRASAVAHAQANLEIGADVFNASIAERIGFLAASARLMSRDDAIRQALDTDAATLASMLESFTRRVGAPVITLFDPEGRFRAASASGLAELETAPFRELITQARDREPAESSGFAYLADELHVLVVVPLYLPFPEIVAWFGLAFPINRAFADRVKTVTRLEVTFVTRAPGAGRRILATTLPPGPAAALPAALGGDAATDGVTGLELEGEPFVTLSRREPTIGGEPLGVVLQRPLRPELAAARALEGRILGISIAALALATLMALWIARGVSQPVHELAGHTRHVAAGDYTRRLHLDRSDELGQLANAFNAMSAGLAERDRIRDLLDKNVSPEVAAQLLRDGAALGGEERDVTVLFSDLRGFTTLSEKLPPRELLALLNRYLDCMGRAIEQHGGVIDKFIGDAIMALFGAPIAQGDAADRAVAAALAMEQALAELNAELLREGRPPLGIGVGINTARVVAGNIGSQRRLNYSVIGDGVNVASRLQALTRTADYRTNIIISAATRDGLRATAVPVRALGEVAVKGRAEPVEIFALGEVADP